MDTAASLSIVRHDAAIRAALVMARQGPGRMSGGRLLKSWIAQRVGLDVPGATGPLTLWEPTVFEDLDLGVEGLIGWPDLRTRNLELRWSSDHLCISYDHLNTGAFPTHLEIVYRDGDKLRPELRVTEIGGFHSPNADGFRVLIDTGSPGGIELGSYLWRRWRRTSAPGAPITIDTVVYPFHPTDIATVIEESYAESFEVGPIHFSHIPVSQMNPVFEDAYDAILGLYALSRLDCIVSGIENLFLASSHANPSLSYEHNRLGATFCAAHESGGGYTAVVAEGGPAWTAGVRSGDSLLEIERQSIDSLDRTSALYLIYDVTHAPAGAQVDLLLRRGDSHTTRLQVRAANILPLGP